MFGVLQLTFALEQSVYLTFCMPAAFEKSRVEMHSSWELLVSFDKFVAAPME